MLRPRLLPSAQNGKRLAALRHAASAAVPSTASAPPTPVKLTIQPAIKRSPTELLEALASTVGTDPTAPHYQYIDDPATTSTSMATRKSYLLCKELGKRAARHLASEWPTLFAFDRDQPRLEAFRPQKMPDPAFMDPTEASLVQLIKTRAVKDACVLYERLREAHVPVSDQTQSELFNLAAFYNNTDPSAAECEWPVLRNLASIKHEPWNHTGVASLVYETLPKSSARDAVMATALAKYSGRKGASKAQTILETIPAGEIPARTYAALISMAKNFEECKSILDKMSKGGVAPDDSVWTEVVRTVERTIVSRFRDRLELYEQIIGEMRALGQTPSLRVYKFVLEPLKDDKNVLPSAITLLSEMLEELEARATIPAISVDCANFFNYAMLLCFRAGNLDMARRLKTVYEKPTTEARMGFLDKQGAFYHLFLMLEAHHCTGEDQFYQLYIDHVPRLIGVTQELVEAVAERLEVAPHWRSLHRLAEDTIASRLITDRSVGIRLRTLLAEYNYESLSPSERDEYAAMVRRLTDVWTEFSRFQGDRENTMLIKFTAPALGDLAYLLCRIGDRERAWELLAMALQDAEGHGSDSRQSSQVLPGIIKPSYLSHLLDDALKRGHASDSAVCMELLARQDTPRSRLEQIAAKIIERCKLNANQARILNGFVRLKKQ